MAEYTTDRLRTVALVGHGAAGKTTLVEQLLTKSKMIGAAGAVEKGTTVSDFDPLEKTTQHSLRSAIVHLDWRDARIHLIDTPGYPDFVGQAIGALDAVETVAVVINASAGDGTGGRGRRGGDDALPGAGQRGSGHAARAAGEGAARGPSGAGVLYLGAQRGRGARPAGGVGAPPAASGRGQPAAVFRRSR